MEGMKLINIYQLGWFSTGRDKAARDLLTAVQNSVQLGEVKAKIAFVFCNRELGEARESDLFLKMVADYHIPLTCFSYEKFRAEKGTALVDQAAALPSWRLDYDREVMAQLQCFRPDLCVLAGYMLIAGGEMCRRYNMINLHPAAPDGPAGTWQEVIWQLIGSKAQETGVMMHLATTELDKGPLVTYCTFPITGEPFDRYWQEINGQSAEQIKKSQGESNPLFKLIRQHGFARELPLIKSTIKTFSQGKIKVNKDKTVVNTEGKPINGYNLTDEINQVVRGTISL